MNLAPRSSGVVGHGESQQQEKEKQGCDHHQLGEFFAGMPDMHEKESDQSRFHRGDAECDGGIEAAQVERSSVDREAGAEEQRDPDW